eukprot:1941498-Rhodomonas_salina.2
MDGGSGMQSNVRREGESEDSIVLGRGGRETEWDVGASWDAALELPEPVQERASKAETRGERRER